MTRTNTRRRKKILKEVIDTHTCNPTIRDLSVWTGVNRSMVHYYLHQLASQGLLTITHRGFNTPLKIIPRETLETL